jgi:hypothetical protein
MGYEDTNWIELAEGRVQWRTFEACLCQRLISFTSAHINFAFSLVMIADQS